MHLSLEIPDEIANRLALAGGDLSRRALEGFALEELRAGRITETQFGKCWDWLVFSWMGF